MNLIIETDIGHDPDDFFALCYLASAGVDIRGIMICPGDPDQIAIARLFCKEIGLDIPIGASKLDRTKLSSGSIHHDLLKK
jgi:inosine-uridine nucleoside N-ribohydrolase